MCCLIVKYIKIYREIYLNELNRSISKYSNVKNHFKPMEHTIR